MLQKVCQITFLFYQLLFFICCFGDLVFIT